MLTKRNTNQKVVIKLLFAAKPLRFNYLQFTYSEQIIGPKNPFAIQLLVWLTLYPSLCYPALLCSALLFPSPQCSALPCNTDSGCMAYGLCTVV